MPQDTREGRADTPPLLLAWGRPANDANESAVGTAATWLAGGIGLVLWTALALLLTSA